jgi:hypothetical protein
MIRIGFRIPSLGKRIAAGTSVRRAFRRRLGLKAPRGLRRITNPKRAAYNRGCNRTTRWCFLVLGFCG